MAAHSMWLAPLTSPAAWSGSNAAQCAATSIFATLVAAIVTKGTNLAKEKAKKTPDIVKGPYDYVVVGGGSTGCVVAARLSEIKSWKVLLLEAGGEEQEYNMVPAMYNRYLTDPFYDWGYSSQKSGWDAGGPTGRGKGLGGSSAVNALHFTRGNRADFDHWKSLNITGWGYADVLPFFKKSENNLDPAIAKDKQYHGTGGPQDVELDRYLDPNTKLFMKAYEEIGIKRVDDVNGREQIGVSRAPSSSSHGERRSSNRAFLNAAVRKRPNLTVQTNAVVRHLIVSKGRAVGVEYDGPGGRKTVYARKEIVLSAGAYNSPQILMLSGIGPKKHLSDVGIKTIVDLPGVGQRLHDHTFASGSAKFMLSKTVKTPTVLDMIATVKEYVEKRTGPLTETGNPANVFYRSSFAPKNLQRPDLQIPVGGSLYSPKKGCVSGDPAGTYYNQLSFGPINLHPKSRGQVLLDRKNPYGMPLIYNNVFGDKSDLKPIIEGYKLAVKLNSTKAFRENGVSLVVGKPAKCAHLTFNSDQFWECSFQGQGKANQHPTSTCSMGPDSDYMAVVTPRLKVRGVQNLRVCDASVLPETTSGNTNAVCILVGEMCSHYIKEDGKVAHNG